MYNGAEDPAFIKQNKKKNQFWEQNKNLKVWEQK